METRKETPKNNNQYQSSTHTISTFLHENNKSNHQKIETNEDQFTKKPFSITKSFRPERPHVYTQEELNYLEKNMKDIRTDTENLVYDENRQMFFFRDVDENKTHKNSADTELVKENNNYNWCVLV